MPRFAANLSMLYPEFNFLDRFEVAARDGFKAVEYLFPYDHPKETIAERLAANGLRQVLFNGPPGDWNLGERGIACLPGREAEFLAGIHKALDYATALACPRIHVMAGVLPAELARETAQAVYLKNLAWAASEAARVGIDILIEPINTRDIPGYLLNRQSEAHAIVQDIGSPHIKVQMDLYHCQIVEGDVAVKLRDYLPSGRVGHLQIAGVPERHEPHIGELNHDYLFQVIDEVSAACGWDGWVGCEYKPAIAAPGGTTTGLSWLRGR